MYLDVFFFVVFYEYSKCYTSPMLHFDFFHIVPLLRFDVYHTILLEDKFTIKNKRLEPGA